MTSSRVRAAVTAAGRLSRLPALLLAAVVLAACASKAPAPANRSASAAPAAKSADSSAQRAPARSASGNAARAARPKTAPKGATAKAQPSAPAAVAQADRVFLRPARGALIASFDGRGNKGMDFAGALGDPVYAARDGKVAYAASELRGYGRMIIIKHDATYLTAYAHNSELLVKNGQSVKRGQVIARMGSSDANRVKLHFELRRNGSAVNPAPYLMPDGAPGQGADPG